MRFTVVWWLMLLLLLLLLLRWRTLVRRVLRGEVGGGRRR
jgi:hypothetical protein